MSTTTKTVEFDAAYDSGQPCTVAEQIAHAVCIFQRLATGHTPRAVSVVLSTDTLVVTLHEALTPAERAVFQSENGAARVREFHQHLFANSSRSLRQEIQFITGLHVRDATAGFRAYSATALTQIDLASIKADGYGFQIEMAYSVNTNGGRISIQERLVFGFGFVGAGGY